MKPIYILHLCVVSVFMTTTPISAYEVLTHQDVSEHALIESDLKKNSSIIETLGLTPAQQFPGDDQKLRTIIDLVKHGAEQEDNLRGSRFLHHFYDPYHHVPLTSVSPTELIGLTILYGQPLLPTQKSFDWALEDFRDLGGDQLFSFKDARRYFFER